MNKIGSPGWSFAPDMEIFSPQFEKIKLQKNTSELK